MAAKAPLPESRSNEITRFNLSEEMQQAAGRKPWQAGIFSKTLVKEPDIRLVLAMLEKGARMKDHHADGSVTIQVLSGSIRLSTEPDDAELRGGQIATLLPSVRHEVEATEPSALLITLSWPESEKLRSMPHRGYA